MVTKGYKLNKMEFCGNFILYQQHKVKFEIGAHNSSSSFEYIYSYLWGPAKVEIHGLVSFIEDFFRRVWVYIYWKNKSDTFEMFNK